jgi:hypothetical protein
MSAPTHWVCPVCGSENALCYGWKCARCGTDMSYEGQKQLKIDYGMRKYGPKMPTLLWLTVLTTIAAVAVLFFALGWVAGVIGLVIVPIVSFCLFTAILFRENN